MFFLYLPICILSTRIQIGFQYPFKLFFILSAMLAILIQVKIIKIFKTIVLQRNKIPPPKNEINNRIFFLFFSL